ncbi:mechanosensitive ion channel family protein [Belliella kenyensis]|uniref:Mechanosensitive ion channel family protein n=1 Tax=Belliella kenyensis TaxID=1472724 RepID=A0ABV8EL93_9BACT|nr:mechanosensitive ion channel domain-containing protein [Belliella kenyensis]MCH7403526.1 mechanosensitive ion channel family protein [Belliella kenyensis]MDN3604952.1 mechanosensitive ion channel [Belliella kenyensis]
MTEFDQVENWIEQILISAGVSTGSVAYWKLLISISLLAIIAVIVFFVTKKVIINYIYKLVRKSPITWDDILADHQVFNNVAHFVPALFVRALAPAIFSDFPDILPFVIKLTDTYLIIVGMTVFFALLKVSEFALTRHPAFKDKPLTSYFQLVRIILYIGTGIFVLSILLGKSPLYFLSAFGAMTAILLLIFKDTILGLVASVQMSSNDMVRVGDWVEMPKFNADGDVIAINLNTVKVQNWDRTITTIPTYYFITDSFKNWRGMVESGGRRIKRSLHINSHSINFVDPEKREIFKKFNLLTNYVTSRQEEIDKHNQDNQIDTSILINGRRMTNIGVFRKYVELYLQNHPKIKKNMTIMVRQLAIEDRGIPIEIYCFTDTTAWLEYESIQADIFDHLLAAAAYFDLEIFQVPSGKDIIQAANAYNSYRSTENASLNV